MITCNLFNVHVEFVNKKEGNDSMQTIKPVFDLEVEPDAHPEAVVGHMDDEEAPLRFRVRLLVHPGMDPFRIVRITMPHGEFYPSSLHCFDGEFGPALDVDIPVHSIRTSQEPREIWFNWIPERGKHPGGDVKIKIDGRIRQQKSPIIVH